MRIENIDWTNRLIFNPDSKTTKGRRFVPLSDRALEVLKSRCGDRKEGWVFQSVRKSAMTYQHPEMELVRAARQSSIDNRHAFRPRVSS